ncbi:MAG: histidine phosphatase family protein [Dehalococcoidales bacterium]|nr:histidine phosphatase family protein [Dehalococcoidales bacterium]
MARLLLVRHGNTQPRSGAHFWGSTDIPLGDEGIHQAGRLRQRLEGEKLVAIYSSPLRRARSTAEIIASAHGVEVTPCTELSECNFGFAEGLTFAEIRRIYPDLADRLETDATGAKFPGGESFADFNRRIRKFLPLIERHGQKDTVLVVAHAGTIRLIICNLLGLGIEHWYKIRIDLASLSIVETYSLQGILSLLNDTSHLDPADTEPGEE